MREWSKIRIQNCELNQKLKLWKWTILIESLSWSTLRVLQVTRTKDGKTATSKSAVQKITWISG